MSTIFDASTLLALLKREPGWEIAEARSKGAIMSSVNLCEVASRLSDLDFEIGEVRVLAEAQNIDVRTFDLDQAYLAAALRPETRRFGLSLGDHACLALARWTGFPVLTADRSWTSLSGSLRIVINSIR